VAIDYDAIFGVDEYDPCEALKALRPAYVKLLTGEGYQRITFRDRTLEFQRAEIKELKSLISQLESECAAANGKSPKRRAITVGVRRD